MPSCCSGHAPLGEATSAGAALPPEWMALLTLMPLMVLFHCAGMCGPLILSFRFGLDREGRGARLLGASVQLLAYQAGRGLLYAGFGILAGLLGQALQSRIMGMERWVVLGIAAALLLSGLGKFGLWRLFGWSRSGTGAGPLARALAWLRRSGPGSGPLFALLLGMIMAFLPCGLTFMTISFAASRGSWWEGGAMMMTLVLLTTPVLLTIGLLPAAIQRFRITAGGYIEAGLTCFGGLWIGLHGAAINGWIPHAKWALTISDRPVMLMLW